MLAAFRPSRGRAAWLGLALWFVACGGTPANEPQAPTTAQPVAQPGAPAAAATTVHEAGSDHFNDAGFELRITSSEVQVGGDAWALVELKSKPPYKCNADYPYRFKVSGSEGLELPSQDIKKDQASIEHDRVVLKIPFKAQKPGAHTLRGQFAFSVCTSDRCLIEKRNLSLQIDAK